MRKFTKTMAAVLSVTMTLTMVTPVFAEGETNITPACRFYSNRFYPHLQTVHSSEAEPELE